jgi:hypothetical protein
MDDHVCGRNLVIFLVSSVIGNGHWVDPTERWVSEVTASQIKPMANI